MKRVKMLTTKHLYLAAIVALMSLVAASLIGTFRLSPAAIFDSQSTDAHIFWRLRVPRTLVAFMAGSGLATCGMIFQALFLNTLATPFTLGVASGASFGAVTVIFLGGLSGLFAGPAVMVGAMLGAGLATLLVLGFSKTRMGHQRHVMLLAGVAVSFFFSSLLLFVQSIASFYESFQMIRWLMGGIAVAGYQEVVLLTPIMVAGFWIVLKHEPQLNLLLLGDDLAQTRGLSVIRIKKRLFLVASAMVAAIVSVTGPIGFIGLVIPHICRILWGGNHRFLAPASLIAGGTVLVLCDLVSRIVMAPSGIPVGVITSLLGAPFFFFLLLRGQYRF